MKNEEWRKIKKERRACGANVPSRAASALRTSLVKLHFVHRPNGPFHIFDSHETFVERQVVSHCVLYKIIHRLNKQRKN